MANTGQPLVCAQCRVLSDPNARGWRGLLAFGDEDVEHDEAHDEVAVYYPACAEREFDGA
jgi:hypothetical protein